MGQGREGVNEKEVRLQHFFRKKTHQLYSGTGEREQQAECNVLTCALRLNGHSLGAVARLQKSADSIKPQNHRGQPHRLAPKPSQ